ncbi:hypothetical protein L7G72_15590 [Xenorhabdus bovienii]|uniref:hypothetical protein n=1 Tax=Xenorhabdus bovienii TaxID=40576 RepID=UPI001EE03737|nr:hypothetical protein [Xenorhabdus bovienii]MCG3463234.1 hypothetical protein [Xenorhabdus bovienii]
MSINKVLPAKTTSSIKHILSVPNKADVVIGQEFPLDINLTTNDTFPAGLNISIINHSGLISYNIDITTVYNSGKSAKATAMLIIDSRIEPTQGDGAISFSIVIGPAHAPLDTINVVYNARKIKLYTIQLRPDNPYFLVPEQDNNPTDNGSSYIKYSAKLFNDSNKPMQNTPIQIYSFEGSDISKEVVITTDTHVPSVISNVTYPGGDYYTIRSDEKGNLSFRAYPIRNTPSTLDIASQIFLTNSYQKTQYQSEIVYIINNPPTDPFSYLHTPVITGLDAGILNPRGDNTSFEVRVLYYTPIIDTDKIIFFTQSVNEYGEYGKPKMIPPALPINIELANKNNPQVYSLPYEIFPSNKPSSLSYVVVKESAISPYSNSTSVIYTGNIKNSPSGKITRVFDKPVVYSSFADTSTTPPLVNSSDKILSERNYINISTISNYVNNKDSDNKNYDAIYVKIAATNDKSHKQLPAFGDQVYLTVYVRSRDVNYKKCCDCDNVINNSCYQSTISSTPDSIVDGKPGATSTTVIPIHYKDLVGITSYNDGEPAWIYFEYYTINSQSNERTYSKYWSSKIDTVLPHTGNPDFYIVD